MAARLPGALAMRPPTALSPTVQTVPLQQVAQVLPSRSAQAAPVRSVARGIVGVAAAVACARFVGAGRTYTRGAKQTRHFFGGGGEEKKKSSAESIYDFTMKDIDDNDVSLSNYKGKVCLIVNVASK
mmetsp:Transcript_50470/g.117827  ORF Transcript_50470/g.117827 Transcript_50470/m.117827 type:complete len:127 (-) Transcript_50470:71-451(-)